MNLYEIWQRRTIGMVKTQNLSIAGTQLLPAHGASILAPNHLNWKDIFLLSAVVPRQIHYVATYELFDVQCCYQYIRKYMMEKIGDWFQIPSNYLGLFLAGIITHRVKQLGAIPVHRGYISKGMFESVKKGLREERMICIFPEGGTGWADKMKEFKMGLSKIVYDLWVEGYRKIPVYPVAIHGTQKVLMPKHKLSLRVGLPLQVDDYITVNTRETLVRFTQNLWEAVHTLFIKTS
jgi:1-acyl-sn-glycerol-3-phosphate acyltransferase